MTLSLIFYQGVLTQPFRSWLLALLLASSALFTNAGHCQPPAEQEEWNSWNILPTELKLDILSYLSISSAHSEIFAVRGVSKEFRSLVDHLLDPVVRPLFDDSQYIPFERTEDRRILGLRNQPITQEEFVLFMGKLPSPIDPTQPCEDGNKPFHFFGVTVCKGSPVKATLKSALRFASRLSHFFSETIGPEFYFVLPQFTDASNTCDVLARGPQPALFSFVPGTAEWTTSEVPFDIDGRKSNRFRGIKYCQEGGRLRVDTEYLKRTSQLQPFRIVKTPR